MEFFERISQVKKPESDLLTALASEYSKIGGDFGYVPVQSALMLHLMKKDSKAGFEVQFGSKEDFCESLRKLVVSDCDICFFVTSSKAHKMQLEDIRKLLYAKFNFQSKRFVLIDIETEKRLLVNFESERVQKGFYASAKQKREDGEARRDEGRVGKPLFREQRRPRRKMIYGDPSKHKDND
jgi:hypothetical protein